MTCVFQRQRGGQGSWSGEEEAESKRRSVIGDEFKEVTVTGDHTTQGLAGTGQDFGSYSK